MKKLIWVLNGMTLLILFGMIYMAICVLPGYTVHYNYIIVPNDQVIFQEVEREVVVEVYNQESPILPTPHRKGKEIILLDKSGSMKDFVNEIYLNNVEFFKQSDVWAFDTELYKNVKVPEIIFEKDTNLVQALNEAAREGYETVWICSDMEHNTGAIELAEEVGEMNIIIYSPKMLDSYKTGELMSALKNTCEHIQLISIN